MFGRIWKVFNNARAIVLAVVVHVIAIGILVVNMEWVDIKPAAAPKSAPIQTSTVDKKLIEKELARVEAEKKRKKAEQEKERKRIEKEKQRLADLEKKRKAEEKRLKALAEKRKKELAAKKKREAEARKKAEAEAKRKKQLAEKKAAEEKRKKEEARKKKLAAEAEKKRKAEEKKRQAELARQRQQKEREQAMLLALEEEENQSRIAQFMALIQSDVQNNWRQPLTARKGMECKLFVRLLPSGEVQSVQIKKSSGDPAFDRSAEDAVYRASPLPVSVSSAGKLFNSTFREFNFIFTPRNL